MSMSTELQSPANPTSETRKILGPGGNRVKVSEDPKRKKENLKKVEKPKIFAVKTLENVVQKKAPVGVDSLSEKVASCKSNRREKSNRLKSVKAIAEGREAETVLPAVPVPLRRCDWITEFSDPVYTSFHDEEWGVPVHDDRKLFELLVLSLASAELTWPAILTKRDTFRKSFENFDPSSIAKLGENKLLALRPNRSTLLSEQKLRAIVENANQLLKIQQEFGSFSTYCWNFVNHMPITNGFRYARRVPAKTPKSDLISKDLMRRGFRCVGPTVIYSFMQVSGMVNDHLLTCFRYVECSNTVRKDLKPEFEQIKVEAKSLEEQNPSPE